MISDDQFWVSYEIIIRKFSKQNITQKLAFVSESAFDFVINMKYHRNNLQNMNEYKVYPKSDGDLIISRLRVYWQNNYFVSFVSSGLNNHT